MATVKITDLPYIQSLQSNTANTVLVGVDIPGDYTGQISLTVLAEGLYSNNNLKVGNNDIIYANSVAQFTGNTTEYLQLVLRNQEGLGSGDFVITADDGNDETNFLNMGLNGSEFNDPEFSSMEAHDGYLYVTTDDNKGNLVLGTTNLNSRIKFIVGGTESDNIVTYISSSGIYSPSIDSIVSANVSTLRGEITANAASANSVINSRISSNIATVNTFAQASFDKANNAIANTNGVFTTGDFYISGDGFVNGTFTLANSTFGAGEAAMTIKATATVQTPTQAGTMLQISGKPNTPSRILFDSYSTDGSAYGIVAGRTARGTVTSPTATQNNDILMRLAGNGWGTTGFAPLGVARIDVVATENYSDTNRGSKIVFYNIPNGSNVVNQIASFNADHVDFTGVVSPTKGFVYVPRILTGAQTAITINFATDSMIRAEFSSTLTMSFSNYTYGKVVEVWLTNTAGNGQTINLGTLANNSTTGSTTLTVASQRSAKLQYFSIDGDLANTFVAVTYA